MSLSFTVALELYIQDLPLFFALRREKLCEAFFDSEVVYSLRLDTISYQVKHDKKKVIENSGK